MESSWEERRMKQNTERAGWIKAVDRTGQTIEFCSGTVGAVFYAVMIVVIMLGVIFRYVIVNPLQWSEELARFLLIWIGFLGMNMATRQGQHLGIDSLLAKLPRKMMLVLDVIGSVFILFFLVFLIAKALPMTMNTMVTAVSMNFSMFWIYLSLPVGAVLTLLQVVFNVILKIAAFARDDTVARG